MNSKLGFATACLATLLLGARAQNELPSKPAPTVDPNTPAYPGDPTVQPSPQTSTGEVAPEARPLPEAKLPKYAELRAFLENFATAQIAAGKPAATAAQKNLLLAGQLALDGISPEAKFRQAAIAAGAEAGWPAELGLAASDAWYALRDPRFTAATRAELDKQIPSAKPAAKDAAKKTSDEADKKSEAPRPRWETADDLLASAPVWARTYTATGQKKYRDGLVRRITETTGVLLDPQHNLFHRDVKALDAQRNVVPARFDSVANGGALLGIARTLSALPDTDPARDEITALFTRLATRLADLRLVKGGWAASLAVGETERPADPIATGLIAAGLQAGVNQGLIKSDAFQPVIAQAWTQLAASTQNPDKPGEVITLAPHAAGALLLAGAEIYRAALLNEADGSAQITVENPAQLFRLQQTVEIPWDSFSERTKMITFNTVTVLDAGTARLLDTQVLDMNADQVPETLLIQTDLLPGQTKNFIIITGPNREFQPQPSLSTFARFVPESLDDFAWENDRIAYRIYGPALLKEPGETGGSGIDVWCKSVRSLVIDKWYKTDDYAEDKGEGCDFYRVGQTRGAGGSGVLANGIISGPASFSNWKIHANGPIRTVFEINYGMWSTYLPKKIETNPAVALGELATNEHLLAQFQAKLAAEIQDDAAKTAAARRFTEKKTITLERGANFNRITSVLGADTSEQLTYVIGTTAPPGDSKLTKDETNHWLAYTAPATPPNGSVHTAILAPTPYNPTIQELDGHQTITMQVSAGQHITYHAGAAWTKGLDYPTHEAWVASLKNYAARLTAPLKVSIK